MSDPQWAYKDGASKLFAAGESVPQGWMDSPDPERGKSAARNPDKAASEADSKPDQGADEPNVPDLEAMTKDEIEALVLARTGVDLDKRRSLAVLRDQARELIAGVEHGGVEQ